MWPKLSYSPSRRATPATPHRTLPHGDVGDAVREVRASCVWLGTKLAFEFLVPDQLPERRGPWRALGGDRPQRPHVADLAHGAATCRHRVLRRYDATRFDFRPLRTSMVPPNSTAHRSPLARPCLREVACRK